MHVSCKYRRLQAIAFFVAFFVSSLLLVNCSNNNEHQTKPTNQPYYLDLESIKQRGKLVVLTENSSTSYFIYRGRPMGFEYELVSMFAEHLEVDLEIKLVQDMDSIFDMLKNGEGDLIACNITATKERSEKVSFSEPYLNTRQVLVQKMPDMWHQMSKKERKQLMLNDPIELVNKKVHVRKNSSFYSRLKSLSDEIGGKIDVIEVPGETDTEELIQSVSSGKIMYTIADENVALINKTYYQNIDVDMPVSFPQKISWAARKNAPDLMKEINWWILKHKNTSTFNAIYRRYFKSSKAQKERVISDYSSLSGGKISSYDELIQKYSQKINWDWRLLASLIYQESKFKPNERSWAGAFGLMQLMPSSAERYGIDSTATPEENIYAGTDKLRRLTEHWGALIEDETEQLKFILASYNAGLGHIQDACALAEKQGLDVSKWDGNVAECILLKSKAKYYNDPVVKYGYCRGQEPFNYVKEVLNRYEHYKKVIL